MWLRLGLMACLACGAFGAAGYEIHDADGVLKITENGAPVFEYQHEMKPTPRFIPERYARTSYIHPLYGLDGEVMTQDFPVDHMHHRGVFWAWPRAAIGARDLDVWHLKGVHQIHEEWLEREADAEGLRLAFNNVWRFEGDPDNPVLRETIRIHAHPADEVGRAIDFDLRFENLRDEPVLFRGAGSAGYGGFNFRPDARRKPMHFTAETGPVEEDQTELDARWVDVSFAREDNEGKSGVAIFQHPGNPGYPNAGWLLRHYGFLGASWPHFEEHSLAPGESIRLRYRLYVHRGGAAEGRVPEAYAAFMENVNAAE